MPREKFSLESKIVQCLLLLSLSPYASTVTRRRRSEPRKEIIDGRRVRHFAGGLCFVPSKMILDYLTLIVSVRRRRFAGEARKDWSE